MPVARCLRSSDVQLVYVTALWITTYVTPPFICSTASFQLTIVCVESRFTAVMTCRFILDLHEAARSVPGGPTTFMDNRTLPPISCTDVETQPPSAESGAPVTSSTIFGAMVSYGQCELELQDAVGEDEDDVGGDKIRLLDFEEPWRARGEGMQRCD